MARSIFYDSLKRILFAFVATMFVAPVFSATLPTGYTELEYIESSGSQYIDTGLKNSDVDEYYIKFKAAYAMYKFIFGNYMDESYKTTRLIFSSSDDGRMLSNVNSLTKQPVSSGGFIANDWNEARSRNDNGTIYFKFNTQAEVSRQPETGIENTRNIGLFSNYAGSGNSKHAATIAHIQFKKNGVLVFNGIPAKNASNVVGMYDTVNGVFYQNAGTGTFTAGPEIQTYTMLEYIAKDNTQYIQTDYVGNLNTRYEGAIYLTNNTDDSYYIASRMNSDNTRDIAIAGSSESFYIGYGLYTRLASGGRLSSVPNKRIDFVTDYLNKIQSVTIDGVLQTRGITSDEIISSFVNTAPLQIFFNRLDGASSGVSYSAPVGTRVYYLKIYDSNTLVHNYVPARRDSDGRVGMLDTLTNSFYDNAASTTVNFQAGPDLPEVTIKIATTKYNEDAFANLVTTLNSAITKVTNIVDTTVAQASSIGTLATTKQDRPADGDCPAGRKCLLVTGTDGKPHWYLIQE